MEIVLPLARLLYPRICGSTNRTHWLILHTGRYHGLVGAGARRRAHPEAAPRRSGYEAGGPPTRSGPRPPRNQRRRLARAKEEKQGQTTSGRPQGPLQSLCVLR